MKHYFYLLCITILLYSCSSDDSSQTPQNTGDLLIKEIRFTSVDSYFPSGVKTFNYEGNRLISTFYTDDEGLEKTVEYLYENDQLSRINFLGNENSFIDEAYTTFTYDANGNLIEFIVHSKGQNTNNFFAIKSVLTYNTDGTEVSKEQFTGNENMQTNPGLISTLFFENEFIVREDFANANFDTDYFYDTENGIYKNIPFMNIIHLVGRNYGGLEGGIHNLMRLESQTGLITSLFVESYTYTYNTQGYPETGTFFEAGFASQNLEYFYIPAP